MAINYWRRQIALSLILVAVLQFGCGGGDLLKSFHVALASSSPLVNSLVASGAIPESKAQTIIADFNAGAGCGLTLQNDFATVSKGLSSAEQRTRKLNASVTALRCFSAIVQRRNFAAHGRIQNVASIAEGILASLVAFYSEPGEIRASAATRASVATRDEKELEASLKQRVEELKKAMRP